MNADLIRLGENARRAAGSLMVAAAPTKNAALEAIARTLEENAASLRKHSPKHLKSLL